MKTDRLLINADQRYEFSELMEMVKNWDPRPSLNTEASLQEAFGDLYKAVQIIVRGFVVHAHESVDDSSEESTETDKLKMGFAVPVGDLES